VKSSQLPLTASEYGKPVAVAAEPSASVATLPLVVL